jgi:hypothetical protein
MNKDKALELALEALEYIDLCDNARDFLHPHECFQLDEAITAIKQALLTATPLAAPYVATQLVQEPVALKPCWYESKEKTMCRKCGQVHAGAILPATQRQSVRSTWVGLSDFNIDELENEYMKSAQTAHQFLRAIEAKLKEKNNGFA